MQNVTYKFIIKLLNKMVRMKRELKYHIYTYLYLQTIKMGWWSKLESARGLMEGVDG